MQMKNKMPGVLLAIYALICAALAFFGLGDGLVGGALAFPFALLGSGLRSMSLSGGAGNICATVIYVIFCLLPVFGGLIKLKRKTWSGKDWLLVLLSGAMFGVMYMMINPGLLGSWGNQGQTVMKSVLGGACWSFFIGWLVLSLLRDLESHGRERVQRWMRVLLWALAAYFVTVAFGSGLGDMIQSIRHVRMGNTGRLAELGTSYLVIGLQFVSGALGNVLSALTALRGAELLEAMNRDRYSQETVEMAEALGCFCVRCLQITVIFSIFFNIAQLVLIKGLALVSVSVNIPLVSVAFVLAMMMLARFLRENKDLKDDNDMFI